MKEMNQEKAMELRQMIIDKMSIVSERSKEKIPYTTIDGIHDDRSSSQKQWKEEDGINWWTNGFWPGMMWLMYDSCGEEKYATIARESEKKLDQCFQEYYGLHHDVGFMWLLSSVAEYRRTKNPESRKRGLHAANLLAGRFNPAGGFIRAWNEKTFGDVDTTGWVIIDCMMNLPLLYWASEEINDPRYRFIAMAHADKVKDTFIREDGSVNHIVEYDPCTGKLVKTYGGQGYAEGSAWTRGQCWAIYGFTLSYIHTGKKEYLDTAHKVAQYFMKHIPEDGQIPVDFNQPAKPQLMDASAGAIAASAFLELARYSEGQVAEEYNRVAEKLIDALLLNSCDWSENTDHILKNCSAAYHDKEHHFSIIYGDYFFMEAIWKLNGSNSLMW